MGINSIEYKERFSPPMGINARIQSAAMDKQSLTLKNNRKLDVYSSVLIENSAPIVGSLTIIQLLGRRSVLAPQVWASRFRNCLALLWSHGSLAVLSREEVAGSLSGPIDMHPENIPWGAPASRNCALKIVSMSIAANRSVNIPLSR